MRNVNEEGRITPRLQSLLHGLRWCGAAMIIASAASFLVQRWDAVGDVPRYLALLGLTVALPVVAYICGVRLRESRSARVLLITLLGLVPIHAGVLGGFVLSQFGSVASSIEGVAQWVAPSKLVAVLLVSGAAGVLIPIVWGAFRVLCRRHAALLTKVFVGLHALLLIPNRSALLGILLIVPMLGAALGCAWRIRPETAEAKVACAALTGPSLLLLCRQVLFYDATSAFWGAVLGVVAVGAFWLGREAGQPFLTRSSTLPAVLSVGAIWFDVIDGIGLSSIGFGPAIQLYGLLAALPLVAFGGLAPEDRRFFWTTAAGFNAVWVGLVLCVEPSAIVALEAIVLGLAAVSHGFVTRRGLVLVSGAGLAGAGFVVEIARAIAAFSMGGWLALAALGLGLVGATAWVEQRARRLAPTGHAESPCQSVQSSSVVLPQ